MKEKETRKIILYNDDHTNNEPITTHQQINNDDTNTSSAYIRAPIYNLYTIHYCTTRMLWNK